jgi:tetratricopeptide (TPR) repeat protein
MTRIGFLALETVPFIVLVVGFPAVTAGTEIGVQEILIDAHKAFDAKDYEKSIQFCDNILLADPNNAEALKLKNSAQQAIRSRTIVKAQEAFFAGQYDAAIKIFDGLLSKNPQDFEVKALRDKAENVRNENEKKTTEARDSQASIRKWTHFTHTTDTFRFRLEWQLHPVLRGTTVGTGNIPDVDAPVNLNEVHLLLGKNYGVAKYLWLGLHYGLMLGLGDSVSWGFELRPLIGFPIWAFSESYGLKLSVGSNLGYHNNYFKQGDVEFQLPHRWQVDGFGQLLLQLGRVSVVGGGGIDINAKPFLMVGLEGG